jgi:hypothetical protein
MTSLTDIPPDPRPPPPAPAPAPTLELQIICSTDKTIATH